MSYHPGIASSGSRGASGSVPLAGGVGPFDGERASRLVVSRLPLVVRCRHGQHHFSGELLVPVPIEFSDASRIRKGEWVKRRSTGERGMLIRRVALYVDRNTKPPLVRFDGKVDAVEVPWEDLVRA